MLKKVNNRWALMSKGSPNKVLKWFGKNKPSSNAVNHREKQVDYFKQTKLRKIKKEKL
jgi:hypothetical protein